MARMMTEPSGQRLLMPYKAETLTIHSIKEITRHKYLIHSLRLNTLRNLRGRYRPNN
jgi:hypothetical protein